MRAALLALALRVWCSTPSSWWKKPAPTKAAVQPADTLTDVAHCGAAPADQAPAGEQLSFLPPPPFCPTWPARGTLAALALERLMDGALLNHNDFIGACGSWRLGAVIFHLRSLGWPIETISTHCPTVQSPERMVARYKLDCKYTAAALATAGGAP